MPSFKSAFSIDFRSVRLFRGLLGALILLDVLYRLPVLRDFYTDDGVLPRFLWFFMSPPNARISLFLFSGSIWWAALIFFLLALSGFLILIDYEARLSSVLAFVLLFSIHHRNWLATYGADNLIRLITICSMIMPTTKGRDLRGAFSNIQSLVVILLVCMFYFCVGWFKGNDAWLWKPDASYIALVGDFFATDFGHWIIKFPNFLKVGTVATLLAERLAWILFLLPWKPGLLRMVAIFIYTALHLSISMTMDLGLFPLTDLVFLTLFLPSEFWEHMTRPSREPHEVEKTLLIQVTENRWMPVAASFILILIACVNLKDYASEKFHLPSSIVVSARAFGLGQNWFLFAPRPIDTTGFFVGEGIKADGKTKVDVLNLKDLEPSFLRPRSAIAGLPNRQWLPFLMALVRRDDKAFQLRFGDYLCERWHQNKNENLKRVDFYYMMEKAPPYGHDPEIKPRLFISRSCHKD